MSATRLEGWYRRFLLVMVLALAVGTAAELILQKHYKETTQLIPFALCGIALVAALVVWFRPVAPLLRAFRGAMLVVILGSVLGGFIHLRSNVEFQMEIRRNASLVNSVIAALSGSAPLLAPGMLGLAGVLGLAATYYHPALAKHAEAA